MGTKPLFLASASPRRQALLTQMGVHYEVFPADIDESERVDESAECYVKRLAIEKAQYIKLTSANAKSAVVLGADTIVVVGQEMLGKPVDRADAVRMLTLLSGVTHQVLTAVAVLGKEQTCLVCESQVTFKTLSEVELDWYCSTGEPMGKAGAYAIQGQAAEFITHLEGSFSSVVGLPLFETMKLLRAEGVSPMSVVS